MSDVFNNIRAELARNRKTIEDLAEALHIERKTFYNWEQKGDFPVRYVPAIATFLRCSSDYLLGIGDATDTTN